ncbi:MAG TPA: succinate dehydrogenase, cytochrome b556 subunit [Gaiellaceae bacterium]
MSAVQIAFAAGLAGVLVALLASTALVVHKGLAGGSLDRLGIRRATENSGARRVAFYVHRLTGVGVFAFLCLHILDVGLFTLSHRLYDQVQELYGTAELRVFECLLLLAVLFHAGNGLRLLLFDLGLLDSAASKSALGVVAAATGAAGIAGSVFILAPVFK